jgi:hypothetical protein
MFKGLLFVFGIYCSVSSMFVFLGWIASLSRQPRDLKNHTISIRLFFIGLTTALIGAVLVLSTGVR